MSIKAGLMATLGALLLAACHTVPQNDADTPSSAFPKAVRPVAPIVSPRWSTEEARDKVREADVVMDMAGIRPGMTVADIGAGEGYYTIRLATRVGTSGRVLAQDIIPLVRDKLADRVFRDKLDNVSVKLGAENDPKLPVGSFDRIFMIHMYHEIAAPYEFLWRLRPSLRVGGRVIIVDNDRPTSAHGTPPVLLKCELAALGYAQVETHPMPQQGIFLAVFEAKGPRPSPGTIQICKG